MTKTFSLPSVEGSEFTVVENTLRKGSRVVFATLGNAALLDVSARSTTKLETHKFLDDLTSRIAAAGMDLNYVTDVTDFFNAPKRWEDFLKTGTVIGLTLTEEEAKVAEQVKALRQKFDDVFVLPKAYAVYRRAEVAKGQDPLRGLTFTKTRIKRGGRSLTIKTVEGLWAKASKLWAVGKTGYGAYKSYDGYYETPSIGSSRISIGCQSISRATMEALATKFNWPDPMVEI
jgi:hypothetical protein